MSNNVIINKKGNLLEDSVLYEVFDRDKLTCVNILRHELIQHFSQLREKINKGSKYFGYGINNQKDSCYIYFQKKRMIMDIDIPYSMKKDLTLQGFIVQERKNFQARSGWVTGIHLDYSCRNIEFIKKIVIGSLSQN